jgi:hypothetical protein
MCGRACQTRIGCPTDDAELTCRACPIRSLPNEAYTRSAFTKFVDEFNWCIVQAPQLPEEEEACLHKEREAHPMVNVNVSGEMAQGVRGVDQLAVKEKQYE